MSCVADYLEVIEVILGPIPKNRVELFKQGTYVTQGGLCSNDHNLLLEHAALGIGKEDILYPGNDYSELKTFYQKQEELLKTLTGTPVITATAVIDTPVAKESASASNFKPKHALALVAVMVCAAIFATVKGSFNLLGMVSASVVPSCSFNNPCYVEDEDKIDADGWYLLPERTNNGKQMLMLGEFQRDTNVTFSPTFWTQLSGSQGEKGPPGPEGAPGSDVTPEMLNDAVNDHFQACVSNRTCVGPEGPPGPKGDSVTPQMLNQAVKTLFEQYLSQGKFQGMVDLAVKNLFQEYVSNGTIVGPPGPPGPKGAQGDRGEKGFCMRN